MLKIYYAEKKLTYFKVISVYLSGGSNPLIRRLYELDVNEGEDDLERHAFDYVRFWRYRIPITVTHLQSSLNEFMAKKRKSTCQILKNFLEKVFYFSFACLLIDSYKFLQNRGTKACLTKHL